MARLRDQTDLLRSAGVLAWTAARLAGARLRAGTVPASIDAVTAGWLESVVRETTPGARIERITRTSADAGTTTRVRFAVASTGLPGTPEALFLKIAPPDLATACFVDAMRLGEEEVRFYAEMAPALGSLVPHAFGARFDPTTRRFAIVLEDLAARGCDLPSVASRPATLADAESMMRALAALHATWWDRPVPAWLRTPTRHRRLFLERTLTRSVATRAAARHASILPDEIRRAVPRILDVRDDLEAAWADAPLTVIHGDAHAGNTFRRPDGTTGLLDWQVVQQGQGMRDVSYYLCNSLPTETRRAHERALIDRYREALAARDVVAPSADAAWRQHRLHAAYAWIAAVFTAGVGGLQPRPVVEAGLARTTAALIDLDSLALALRGGNIE